MKGMPQIGETYTYTLKTSDEMSASRFQESSPAVFATPFLVGAVEGSGARLLEPWLEASEMTVGATVDLKHQAPTPLGWEVKAVATLVEAKGRKFVFQVDCFDELEKIGEARHTRFVIESAGFMQQVASKVLRRP
jgi:fluoroacetyl-CoA thioesterase